MKNTFSKRILCIVGPTASGKTALAVAVAKALNGEVISCDSMQIYRHLSIGTAKPTLREQDGVPHHLIDFADPREPFSCADYVTMATDCANDILLRGKLPIFCGGTGLYLDNTVLGTAFSSADNSTSDGAVLAELQKEFERDGIDGIYTRLASVDPQAAESIHKNNTKRVLRALEIYLVTGKTKTEWDARSHDRPMAFDACYIGLDFKDRSILHERINLRVTRMLEEGLLDEVSALYRDGFLPKGSTAAQAIGYKEFLGCIHGEMSVSEAADRVRAATRQYAKRQLTWFRRNRDIHWLYPDTVPFGENVTDVLLKQVIELFQNTR